jgi:hypothetical protein
MKTLRCLSVLLFPLLPAAWGGVILVMTPEIGNGIVAAQPSRVCVPPGAPVMLAIPDAVQGLPYPTLQWLKDGAPIPGATSGFFAIQSPTAADSGHYRVTPDPAFPLTFPGIVLDVVSSGHLANSSSRLALKAGNDVQIFGFVVTGTVPKRLLIRAVGPSLAPMGVPDFAALPKIRLFDAKGLAFGSAHADTVDWAGLFQRAGAFPLTGNERLGVMCDVQTFPPGAYSVHVTDDARLGGTVLVEVYEP